MLAEGKRLGANKNICEKAMIKAERKVIGLFMYGLHIELFFSFVFFLKAAMFLPDRPFPISNCQ